MNQTLKRNLLLLASLAYLLGGITCFYLIASSNSMEQNTVWGGYSAARLAMMAIVLATLFINGVILWVGLFRSGIPLEYLARFESNPKFKLRVTAFFSILSAGALIVASLLVIGILFPGSNLYILRAYQLIAWLEITLLFSLGILWSQYGGYLKSQKIWLEAVKEMKKAVISLPLSLWLFLLAAGCVLGVLIAYSPAFAGRMPRHDSGIFLYFGSRILKGDIPFRDLWDHKPPLIFYIDALGLLLADQSLWGVWFLEVISLLLSLYFLFNVLEEILNPSGMLLASLGLIAGFVFSMEGGNLTEEFGLPLQCFSVWLFCRYVIKDRHKNTAWLGIGIALGLAVMLKQTLIGVWLAIFLVAAYWVVTQQMKVNIWDGAWFLGGLAAVLIIWTGYFAINNSLWDFWDVAFRFNFIYSGITWPERFEAVRIIFEVVFFQRSFVLFLGLAAWIFFLVTGYPYHKKLPVALQIALINFPIEIGLISLSGENYDHYFFTIIPCVSILIGCGWSTIFSKMGRQNGLRWAVYAGLLSGLVWLPGQQVISAYGTKEDAAFVKVAEYVQAHTDKKDFVLFWGDQTALNYISDRDAPTRFVHQKPLFWSGYASGQLSAEMLKDLSTKKPTLIIDTHLSSTPFIRMDETNRCIMPDSPLPDGMAEVFNYICSHYSLVDDLGGKDKWLVYKFH